MAPPGSRRWAYVWIMAGTIVGGGLGFYVMLRIETSYKVRMEERLRRWQAGVPLPWLAVGRPGQVRQDPTGSSLDQMFKYSPIHRIDLESV
ncbi:uncharacterized protein LOC119361086 [Triticum dicoccoides]|uniref:uncharacterized protein LOC119361086 n=1 Tax=Triticum dicoccoides TaxID=85692 RepID=UPI00188FF6F4|nr:uncharacterized protein LOC119361086 [Triticum dicoccoides]